MDEITLSEIQAQRICKDYQYVIGNSYDIDGSCLVVESIEVKELENKVGFTVVLYFALLDETFKLFYIIDIFCEKVGIPFDINKYLK